MYTKSLIQQQREEIALKQSMQSEIESLLEHYDVSDSAFAIVDGRMTELTNGYFAQCKQYDSLHEALRNMSIGQSLLVKDEETFVVGNVYKTMNEAVNGSRYVFDINRVEYL